MAAVEVDGVGCWTHVLCADVGHVAPLFRGKPLSVLPRTVANKLAEDPNVKDAYTGICI